jgi:hypothetical protein
MKKLKMFEGSRFKVRGWERNAIEYNCHPDPVEG